MISAALLRRYSAQPHPFTLHLADGRKIRVPQGAHLSVQPEGLVFMLWKPKEDVEFYQFDDGDFAGREEAAGGGFGGFSLKMIFLITAEERSRAVIFIPSSVN